MTHAVRLLKAPLLALLLAAGGAQAASIVGDTFELGVSFDDAAGGAPVVAGPAAGVATGVPGAVFSSSEANIVLPFNAGTAELRAHALWVDEDTVHLFLQGDATEFTGLSLTLSGLDFKSAGSPASITGASFNRDGGGGGAFSGYDEVIFGIVRDPVISFTASSVTMRFDYFSANLTADGPTMEINVTAGVVPEPASTAMLLGGLGLIGLARRRLSGRQ
jgi:PEP-CTERM motif